MSNLLSEITNIYQLDLLPDRFPEIIHNFRKHRVKLNNLCLIDVGNGDAFTVVPKNSSANMVERCFNDLGYFPMKVPVDRKDSIPTVRAILKLLQQRQHLSTRTLFAEPLDYLQFMIAIKPASGKWDELEEHLFQLEYMDTPWIVSDPYKVAVVIRPFSENLETESFPDLLMRLASSHPSLTPAATWVFRLQDEFYGMFAICDDKDGILDSIGLYEIYTGLSVERKWLNEGLSESTMVDLFDAIVPYMDIIESIFTAPGTVGTAMLYG